MKTTTAVQSLQMLSDAELDAVVGGIGEPVGAPVGSPVTGPTFGPVGTSVGSYGSGTSPGNGWKSVNNTCQQDP